MLREATSDALPEILHVLGALGGSEGRELEVRFRATVGRLDAARRSMECMRMSVLHGERGVTYLLQRLVRAAKALARAKSKAKAKSSKATTAAPREEEKQDQEQEQEQKRLAADESATTTEKEDGQGEEKEKEKEEEESLVSRRTIFEISQRMIRSIHAIQAISTHLRVEGKGGGDRHGGHAGPRISSISSPRGTISSHVQTLDQGEGENGTEPPSITEPPSSSSNPHRAAYIDRLRQRTASVHAEAKAEKLKQAQASSSETEKAQNDDHDDDDHA